VNETKIPIIIWADLQTAPLGQPSKLLADFAGQPLLRQTMQRVCQSQKSGKKIVFCLPDQQGKIKSILTDLPVEVLGIQFDLPGWWPGIQSARKWAMDCWRGGLLGTCAFDEDLIPHVLAELVRRLDAPAVMTVPAHAAWIDPKILDRQIDQYLENQETMKINFSQAPPGLSGLILERNLIENLPRTTKIAGSIIGYHPDNPQMDLISKPCNLPIDSSIIQTGLRFTCDTQRSLTLCRLLATKLNPQSASIMEVAELARTIFTPYPKEIEIEFITGWPWEKGYRPTPQISRGPIDPEKIISRVAELTKECDDLVIHIGGFGEPTRHPQFEELIHGFKQSGAWGIGLQTTGLFDPAMTETLAELPIDILYLLIDVPHRELYQKIMGVDCFEKVTENINRLIHTIQTQNHPIPLLVPAMIKTCDTMELMDEFFDGWIKKVGWAVIEGFSDYAGQLADLSVTSMAGPKRKPCRQITGRLTILADGTAVICNQDFNRTLPAGSIHQQSLLEIWQGAIASNLRSAHATGNFSPNTLCQNCRQWHRA